MEMKKSRAFLIVVALLLLCVTIAALLVAMDGDDQAGPQDDQQAMDQQAAEQLEGQQQGQAAGGQEEQSSDQQTADQQPDQQEGQSTDQQASGQQDLHGSGGGQSRPGGKSLADLRRALGGEVELYHGAELDTSEEAVNEMNETGGWILLARDAPDRVIQFYDHELRGTRDLTKQEGGGSASFSFRTNQGKAVIMDIEPAGSTSREGTRIIITIEG